MTANFNTTGRIALERLMQEFASASSECAPLFHQRLSVLPSQQLTRKAWEEFHLANYLRLARRTKTEWQEWVPHPDGSACSRFFGVGDKAALDHFRRLADTGTALLKSSASNPGPNWYFETSFIEQIESAPTDKAFLCWLDALHLTAKQCRTLFLHATVGNWAYTAGPHESVEQVASVMSDPTPFGLAALPIHPVMESLQHGIFRSSVEAIKVWLGMEDVVPVGDWAERPPIYLPSPFGESAIANDEGNAPPTPAANKLEIDRDTFTVSYRGQTCKLGNTVPFRLLERLNQRPGVYLSITTLIDDVWKDESTESGTVQKTVSLLRKRLNDEGVVGIRIDGSEPGHYSLILK